MNDAELLNLAYSIRDGGLFAFCIWLAAGRPSLVGAGSSAAGPAPAATPPIAVKPKPRFTGIVATSFAGQGDVEKSAYTGAVIDPDYVGASLPYRFAAPVPTLTVFYKGKSVSGVPIVDIGPWNTNDAYWNGSGRPQAESGTDNSGRRTNFAGLDLTPGTWEKLGVSSSESSAVKDKVDWDFDSYLAGTVPAAPSPAPVAGGDPPWLIKARQFNGLTWNSGPMPSSMKAWMQQIATAFPEMAAEANMLAGMNYWEWCGGFVQSMLAYSNIRGPFGPNDTDKWPWAFAWATWGTDAMSNPQPGDVCVFRWASGGGHVCFYDHEVDDNYYHCTGGDQGTSLQVSTEAMPMANCIAIRRPPAS